MIAAGLSARPSARSRGGRRDDPALPAHAARHGWRAGVAACCKPVDGARLARPAGRAGSGACSAAEALERARAADAGRTARRWPLPRRAEAAAAGRLAHLLLQLLPEVPTERRDTTAVALAEARGRALPPNAVRGDRCGCARAAWRRPASAELFAEGALAEVPVAGLIDLPDGTRRPVSGRIDRLAVTADSSRHRRFQDDGSPARRCGCDPARDLRPARGLCER